MLIQPMRICTITTPASYHGGTYIRLADLDRKENNEIR